MSKDNKSDNKLTKEDIRKICEAIAEAYKLSGKEIQLATLHEGDETEILVDNRKEEQLN